MSNDIKLTSLVKTSGCAAKIGPGVLDNVLKNLPKFEDSNLIVGFDKKDDACVYKVNNEQVMIQTVDFFPPMVDDPYIFGQIAAANALSDVYAMGGNPTLAMNLLCFPSCLPSSLMHDILAGGYSKIHEAGAIVAGGHTISDPTPKYGLSVTGLAHPSEILTNSTAQYGDVLVLTKPLGVGILNTASKADLLSESEIREVTEVMTSLNKHGKDCFRGLNINACTDITGFSLIGHSNEMASGSNKSIEIYSSEVPILNKALDFAKMGIIPEGMYNNFEYLKNNFSKSNNVNQEMLDILFDPQTSGGLLVSMNENDAKEYLSRMECYTSYAKIIGSVTEKKEYSIIIK